MSDIIHNQLQLNQLCISGEITQFNYLVKNFTVNVIQLKLFSNIAISKMANILRKNMNYLKRQGNKQNKS